MYILKLLFSFKGNISRFEYLIGLILAYIIGSFGMLFNLIFKLKMDDPTDLILTTVFYLLGMLFLFVTNLALGTKRLRDLAWEPWMVVLFLIPVGNIVMQVLGVVLPGKKRNEIPISAEQGIKKN